MTRIERLAYTRTQAAAALGVSRSTFDRRVLPLIETIEMPWGTQLIPADALERVLGEHRRAARRQEAPQPPRGRRATVSPDVAERIRVEHDAGSSLAHQLMQRWTSVDTTAAAPHPAMRRVTALS